MIMSNFRKKNYAKLKNTEFWSKKNIAGGFELRTQLHLFGINETYQYITRRYEPNSRNKYTYHQNLTTPI